MTTERQRREAATLAYRELVMPIYRHITLFAPQPTTISGAVYGALDVPSNDEWLLQAVSRVTGLSAALITGRSTARQPSRARFLFMLYANTVQGRTRANIGLALNRDHTTIIAGIRRAHDLRITDAEFRRQYKAVKEALSC